MEFTGVVQRLREGGGAVIWVVYSQIGSHYKDMQLPFFIHTDIFGQSETRTPHLCLIAMGFSGARIQI